MSWAFWRGVQTSCRGRTPSTIVFLSSISAVEDIRPGSHRSVCIMQNHKLSFVLLAMGWGFPSRLGAMPNVLLYTFPSLCLITPTLARIREWSLILILIAPRDPKHHSWQTNSFGFSIANKYCSILKPHIQIRTMAMSISAGIILKYKILAEYVLWNFNNIPNTSKCNFSWKASQMSYFLSFFLSFFLVILW